MFDFFKKNTSGTLALAAFLVWLKERAGRSHEQFLFNPFLYFILYFVPNNKWHIKISKRTVCLRFPKEIEFSGVTTPSYMCMITFQRVTIIDIVQFEKNVVWITIWHGMYARIREKRRQVGRNDLETINSFFIF
jgi:hypothetical protein